MTPIEIIESLVKQFGNDVDKTAWESIKNILDPSHPICKLCRSMYE